MKKIITLTISIVAATLFITNQAQASISDTIREIGDKLSDEYSKIADEAKDMAEYISQLKTNPFAQDGWEVFIGDDPQDENNYLIKIKGSVKNFAETDKIKILRLLPGNSSRSDSAFLLKRTDREGDSYDLGANGVVPKSDLETDDLVFEFLYISALEGVRYLHYSPEISICKLKSEYSVNPPACANIYKEVSTEETEEADTATDVADEEKSDTGDVVVGELDLEGDVTGTGTGEPLDDLQAFGASSGSHCSLTPYSGSGTAGMLWACMLGMIAPLTTLRFRRKKK